MKLIFLLSTIWLITTTTWAYSNDCAKGPEYWCRDISTAEECGAMRHCQQNVWREKENTKNSMTKSETAHMLCNVLVQATTELLTDGSIDVNSIKQYLRNDCTKLPDQNNIIHQCQMAVDLYLSDILRHIQSGTKAEKICPIIQGHDSQSVFIPTPKPIGLTPNQTCVLCEFIVYMIQTFAAANSTAQELTKILENICQIMPDVLKNECKSFVDTYGFDIIVLILRDVDSNKTCALLKLCPKPTNVAFLIKPNANTCGLCDYVSTYLSAGYPIENVCTAFSTNNYIKQQCEVLVHLYKPNYCSQLPICYEDVVIQPIEQSIETTINSVPCSLCQYVISYVDTVIQNNKTEAAIEAALEKVCSILPGALKDKCVQFVDTYGPVLLQLIEKYGTPDKVCNALKLCHNGTQEITPVDLTQMLKIEESSIKSVQCSLCQYVISYVDTIIQNNKSEAAIEAALEKVCSILPGALKDKCVQFVDTYGPVLLQLIEKYGTPDKVCNALKLCHNGTETLTTLERIQLMKFEQVALKAVPCLFCKYAIGLLEIIIGDNRSAAAIEAALDKVCDYFPGSLKDNCTNFVHHSARIIAFLLARNATPAQICNFLKFCHDGTQEITPYDILQMYKIKESSINSVQCSLCKYVINYVDTVIQNNKSEAAIEDA
ncbi:unnamed protein product [Rotaria sordida]|uniref:Prosaposin n=2 Tax=Rotaria sordida TaxID=392033 RepID=A0A815WG74_9BILA|nr:unnamed protein product [Rotaria sordida]